MKKILAIVFIVLLVQTSYTLSQEPLHHQKRIFRGDGHKLYINKDLPIFIRIAASPDDTAQTWLLYSETSRQFTNPMYLDSEGWNSLRSPSAVDTVTRKLVTPVQDIVFELYTDGLNPVTHHKFEGAVPFISNGIKHFGKNPVIELVSTDENSGIDQTYFSLNSKPWIHFDKNISVNEEGEYELKYYSVDNVGNVEQVKYEKFVIDFTPPLTQHFVEGINMNNVLAKNATIILQLEDKITGVNRIFYSIDGGNFIAYSRPISVSVLKDGEAKMQYYAVDNVGNKEEVKTIGTFASTQAGNQIGSEIVFDFYIDREPPVVDIAIEGDQHSANNILYISERSKIRLGASDDKSGVQAIYYSSNSFLTKDLYTEPFTPLARGLIKFSYNGIDYVENISEANTQQLFVDNINPTSVIRFEGKTFTNRDTLFITSETNILLGASDTGSGLKEILLGINNNTMEKYSAPINIKEQGVHSLNFYAIDNVKNTEAPKSQVLYVDNDPPQIHFHFSVEEIGAKILRDEKFTIFPSNAKLYIAATDNLSGSQRIEYTVNGGEKRSTIPIENFKPGNYEVQIITKDFLGNHSTQSIKFSIEK